MNIIKKNSIGEAKEFMQLWVKFHELYKAAMKKTSITPEEEAEFFQTKSIVARKFQKLAESLSIDRVIVDRAYDVINQILSLKSISNLSESTLDKLEADWHESYINLNRLIGHLEAQKEKAPQSIGPGMRSAGKYLAYFVFVIIVLLVTLYLAYILGIVKLSI